MKTYHPQTQTFSNPLSDGAAADPFVLYRDGYYYALHTEADKIAIFRSPSLATVLKDQRKVVFTLCGEVQGHIWAPELHYLPSTGRWYIYACGTARGRDFKSMRMFCLESLDDDPFGEYVFKGYTDPDILAIDQTVFYDEKSGTLYTAFSQFTELGQVITLAVMEDPWTVSDRRLRLSYPKYDWERQGPAENKDERVNEGPIFLQHEGKLVLIYSASGCWSEFYCLGMVEFTGRDFSADCVMDPGNWKKAQKPIFSAANGVYGVGHCSFFRSPGGSETWIAYHGMHTPDAGEKGRYMYAQPISFDKNGLPAPGRPLSRDTRIPLPGESSRTAIFHKFS